MPCARNVGMRKLIDQNQFRFTLENAVEIHFLKFDAAIFDDQSRQHLKPFDEIFGFAALMRFDDADNDIDALRLARLCSAQHGKSFADAGRGADEYLKLATRTAP